MAITRAQQAKQLLANGGRIGYRGGADMGAVGKEKDIGGAIGGGSKEKISASDARDTNLDRAREIYQANETLKLLEEDKAQEPFETLIIKDSGIPGAIGMGLDALRGPRQFMLNKNVDFYRFDPRTRKAREKYGLTAQGYKEYMRDRMAGNIDAAGNPIMGGDDDDNNMFLPADTTATTTEEEVLSPIQQAILDRGTPSAFLADGGMPKDAPVGGIMDLESGRQMYFLGKLVKKATRAVKKIVKSPIGKLALLYAGGTYLGGLKGVAGTQKSMGFLQSLKTPSNLGNLLNFGKSYVGDALDEMTTADKFKLGIGGALTLAPLLFQQEEEQPDFASSAGPGLPAAIPDIRNRYRDYMARGFLAEGGKAEPVAKKTMPLLDMDGKEMDFRAEGGFVPIGRMERADDVPARLSKNEFVFTADAVRNAGEGDIDKGAEVMYNMMKNLEAGGEVSEESQGLNGARKMFQTSQRLEEVL